MNLTQEIETTQAKLEQTVARINELEREKQSLLQESLRLDGELRALKRLQQEGK